MPSKVDCADGIRKMLGWDKHPETEVTDDITELLVMIRRKSGQDNALPEKTNYNGYSDLFVTKSAQTSDPQGKLLL